MLWVRFKFNTSARDVCGLLPLINKDNEVHDSCAFCNHKKDFRKQLSTTGEISVGFPVQNGPFPQIYFWKKH